MALASPLIFLVALQTATQAAQVVVSPDSFDLAVDETRQLRVQAFDMDGNPIDQVTARWLSANADVASVDAEGVVTALRPGKAEIFVFADQKLSFSLVNVPQPPPSTIELGIAGDAVLAGASTPVQVTARTRFGDELDWASVSYESSDPSVATVDGDGRIYGVRPGRATIRATSGAASAQSEVRVTANPAVAYELVPDRKTVRTGDVVRYRVRALSAGGDEVAILRPAWSVSGARAQIEGEGEGAEGVFVAEQPGTYRITALIGRNLARSVTVDVVERRLGSKLVKLGRGPISTHNSGDMWAFEGVDGRDYVYIGTFWYDWMKVWDVTDPAVPVLTDSIQVDARRINDVKIHPNNRLAVITREGASDRQNGIVLLDLSRPAHPTILSEYKETVSGGVHNVWIRGDENLVYACHNGTSDLHVIDISDPQNPREVGRWGLEKRNKTLHDVIVQDGYAYLSYWDDGIIMLDVGAGTHGGTPTEPALVSQFKYPIGHTHVTWRSGRYLFVGDEIFPRGFAPPDAREPVDARGYIHVIDYSDPENPRDVARYEVPEAGSHNIWVEGDKLYVGYYQGGLRIVDISGELRGDLYRQGRELAVIKTTDKETLVPNYSMTWGAQVFKGNIYSSDFNSGLWVTRLVEPQVIP